MSEPIAGYISVKIYAGLPGAEPIEVGTVRVPLTLRATSTKTIEAHLSDAVEYVAADFERVFGSEAAS
jgi:hypothetical protein